MTKASKRSIENDIKQYEYVCYTLMKYVLSNNNSLTSDDIIYASNLVTTLYDFSYKYPQSFGLTQEKLLLLLTLSNQLNICKFALAFNERLIHHIKSRNDDSLVDFIENIHYGYFVEIFDNPYLEDCDKSLLIKLIDIEYKSISAIYNEFSLCEGLTCNFYDRCYNDICINECVTSGCSAIEGILVQANKIVDTVYIIDKSSESSTPEIFCFDLLSLCFIMNEDNPVNPKTDDFFHEFSLNCIQNRFRKEIAMVRRFIFQ